MHTQFTLTLILFHQPQNHVCKVKADCRSALSLSFEVDMENLFEPRSRYLCSSNLLKNFRLIWQASDRLWHPNYEHTYKGLCINTLIWQASQSMTPYLWLSWCLYCWPKINHACMHVYKHRTMHSNINSASKFKRLWKNKILENWISKEFEKNSKQEFKRLGQKNFKP